MPINKNQWKRLQSLLGMLRRGNAVNFENYKTHMLFDDPRFEISPRTFSRDIAALKKLGADIRYRRKYNCFELKNKDWSFTSLPTAQIDDVKPLLLSERIAQNFLPAMLRVELRKTVDAIFESREINIPDATRIADFQVITPAFSPEIDAEIFRKAYQAWENSRFLKISYCSIAGHESEKLIVPRVFAWNNGCWYVKGFVAIDDGIPLNQPWKVRIFALHRIRQAEIQGAFVPSDEDFICFDEHDLFDFQKYEEVELEFFYPEADRIKEIFISDAAAIAAQSENSVTIRLKDVSEHAIYPLIFKAMGNVRVIKPAELRESLKKIAQSIFDNIT